jgi:hypothetical protein
MIDTQREREATENNAEVVQELENLMQSSFMPSCNIKTDENIYIYTGPLRFKYTS